MRVEGLGDVAPAVISRPIPPLYQALLKSETDRRQNRDNNRTDAWGRGFLPNAHELGTIMQAVMCQYMDVPLDLTHVHDGGVDFEIQGVPVQAKATFKLDTPAIRGCELDTNKLYLLAKVRGTFLDIFGYCDGRTFIRHKKQKILPSGPDNWQIDSKFLRSAEEMKNIPKPKNTLRYPGGKTTMMGQLAAWVPSRTLFDSGFEHYIELFVGGGAMLFELMSRGKSWTTTVLNDLDVSLMAIYTAARDYPQELKRLIINCTPSVKLWERAKQVDGSVDDVVQAAAAKLVLHYCSHAGLGYMAGSAQGGKTQESKYPIGCRWNPLKICRAIDDLNSVLSHGVSQLHSADFLWVLENAMPEPATTFIFADPPYVEAGEQLYRHSFTEEDHRRLAEAFHNSDARWLLTYDDCPLIRDLYPDNIVYAFPATSGNNHVRKHGELVITK